MNEFDTDVVILGGSRAGHVAAHRLAELGMSVILVDEGPGVRLTEQPVSRDVQVVIGTGRITSRNVIEVSGKRFRTREIVVATGSRPRIPEGLRADGRVILTAADAQELRRIPDAALIIGGGTIGCEFASAWAGAGCAVTLVEASSALLVDEDRSSVQMIEDCLRNKGIHLRIGNGVIGTERTAAGARTILARGEVIESDIVLIATGREPSIDGLGLAEVGVEVTCRGIRVDEYCRTTIKGIHAVGDVLRVRRSVRAGYVEAMLVAERIAGLPVKPLDYEAFPRVVHTGPPMGAIGLTAIQAEDWYGTACVETSRYMVAGAGEPTVSPSAVRLVSLLGGPVVGIHVVGVEVECMLTVAKDVYERELSVGEAVALLRRALRRVGEGKVLVPEPLTAPGALNRVRRRIRPVSSDGHQFSCTTSVQSAR